MIPSRAIRPAGHAFITCQKQLRVSTPSSRLFSSKPPHTTLSIPPSRTPRNNGLFSFRTIGSSNASFVPPLFSCSASAAAFFARHASTAPPPSAAPSATAVSSPPPAPSIDALPDTSSETISSITDLSPVVDISSLPEQIGYLKSLGLEYGYGPTSLVQWVLEHIHIYAGTPWWASVMIAAVLIRLGTFVLWYRAANDTAKMAALSPELAPLNARLKDVMMSSDMSEAVRVRTQITEIHRSMGIKMSRTFYPIIVQTILGFGAFKLMRAMANLPVPGWETGGFGWITDLTISDPYYVLPVALASVVYITAVRGGESGSMNAGAMGGTPGMAGAISAMKYVAPVLMGLIMLTFPAGLQLSFMVTSIFGLTQSYVLRNNKIRVAIGLLPLLPPSPPGANKAAKMPVVNYQPPTAHDTLAKVSPGDLQGASLGSVAGKEKQGKSGGVLSGVKKELGGAKEQFGLLWKNVKAKVGAAQSQAKDGQKSQQFKRQAEAYERRKQKEIEEQRRWEREEKEERRARKERY